MSVPVVNLGVAAVVTTEQMVVMDAATSFARYGEEAGACVGGCRGGCGLALDVRLGQGHGA